MYKIMDNKVDPLTNNIQREKGAFENKKIIRQNHHSPSETIHSMKNRKKRMINKLDICKAYDMLKWNLIRQL
jgi:hypothetical protein